MAAFRMPQTQREQLMVIIGVLGLLGAGAYWYYVYGPQTTIVATETAKLDTLNMEIDKLKTQLQAGQIQRLKQEAKDYAQSVEVMRKLVPTGNEVPELLDQISNAARRAGLEARTFNPLGPEIGQDFDAYRYALAVTGGYHDVAAFITHIASLPRIVVPMAVTVSVPQNAQQAGAPIDPKRTTQVVFEAHTYVAHTSAPRPATAKGNN